MTSTCNAVINLELDIENKMPRIKQIESYTYSIINLKLGTA